MKFRCEKQLLNDAISTTQKAITGKSNIPALEGVLLRCREDRVELLGYDLEIGICCSVEAQVEQKGEVVLNARLFGDIIRKMPDDTIYCEVNDRLVTTIRSGRAEFSITAINAADYPAMPTVEQEQMVELPQKTMRSMIRQTVFAVSQSDSKPVHTGALFELKKGTLVVVGVDGYRLAVRKEALPGAPDLRFIVPGKTLQEVARILKDDEEQPVRLCYAKKHILFQAGNVMIVSRLLEGEFLNYEGAIPKNGSVKAKVAVKPFCDCVERTSLLISEKMRSPIRLTIDGSVLTLKCTTAMGKVYDAFDIDNLNGSIEIGFNNRYLLDALKGCECDEVLLEMNTPLTPCVIRPVNGDGFLFLVLPVRLKNEAEGAAEQKEEM